LLRGSIGLTSIRIFCPILIPYSLYDFAQNVNSLSAGGSDHLPKFHRDPFSLRAKQKNANAWDIWTTSHNESITATVVCGEKNMDLVVFILQWFLFF